VSPLVRITHNITQTLLNKLSTFDAKVLFTIYRAIRVESSHGRSPQQPPDPTVCDICKFKGIGSHFFKETWVCEFIFLFIMRNTPLQLEMLCLPLGMDKQVEGFAELCKETLVS
jgi:hypothetical protein